ncbi:SPOR domain-containing protein [Massilia sp.]|uniref:SPOR domain-containing protein n=1 Tax=Massilia sp. TaxID=1882437 RepID=UPI0028A08998|nr:SPOR domain-containing protein [Massilia sp.]
MGLFSFGNKNKQETVRDSGHFVKDDDAAYTERARSKRASSAGDGARSSRGDPMLPEKKRARRRLVGAVALTLAAIVALPMLLDSEPKPLATDIAINIPDKEKAAPLPVPSEQVPASASVDSDEEIIDPSAAAGDEPAPPPPATTTRTPAAVTPAPTAPAAGDPPPLRTLDLEKQKPALKPEPVKPEPARKPEPEKREEKKPVKVAEAKPAETHPKAEKVVEKTEKPPRQDDAARAIAILEGKPASVPTPAPAAASAGPSPRYVVQVAALASQEKVKELQERLRAAGVSSFTQKSGELIRVRVGPFSKEEAEQVRAKLGGIGLSGSMVPL